MVIEKPMGWLTTAKVWARRIKQDVVALWIAARDPRTPILAKVAAAAVAVYALSPIDLIPDFVPVLGYLDDLLIVPLGIMLAVSLIPVSLMAEFRSVAASRAEKPISRVGMGVMIAIWVTATVMAVCWAIGSFVP